MRQVNPNIKFAKWAFNNALNAKVSPDALLHLPSISNPRLSLQETIDNTNQRLLQGIDYVDLDGLQEDDQADFWKLEPEPTEFTLSDVLYSLLKLDSRYKNFAHRRLFTEAKETGDVNDHPTNPTFTNPALAKLLDAVKKHQAIDKANFQRQEQGDERYVNLILSPTAPNNIPEPTEDAALLAECSEIDPRIRIREIDTYCHGLFIFLLQMQDFLNGDFASPIPDNEAIEDAALSADVMADTLQQKIHELRQKSLEQILLEQGLYRSREYYQDAPEQTSMYIMRCQLAGTKFEALRLISEDASEFDVLQAQTAYNEAKQAIKTSILQTCKCSLNEEESTRLDQLIEDLTDIKKMTQSSEDIKEFCRNQITAFVALYEDEAEAIRTAQIKQLEIAKKTAENLYNALNELQQAVEKSRTTPLEK